MGPSRAHRAPRAGERGFTLVELMTTVIIVGVLAVAAYAGYRKFVTSSHQTEANHILSGIKTRQEAYKAETGQYLNVSVGLAYASPSETNFAYLYPHCLAGAGSPGAFSVTWPAGDKACGSCCTSGTDWLKLNIQSDAPTYYGYTTISGCGATGTVAPQGSSACLTDTGSPSTVVSGMTINGNKPNWPATTTTSPWFVATAVADTNGDGVFTTVMISSIDNSVYVDNDGQ